MVAEEIQLPPFRHVDDFILASSRFGMPDCQNKERWNNRILQNLLYYQTNYMVVALIAFCFVMYLYPLETIFGGVLVSGFLIGIIFASQNRGAIQRFKHNYPALVVALIVGLATLIMYWLGSIAVFVFSIALPMLLILLHASFRMRNFRNKVQNKAEAVGLKTTPMGLLLKSLDFEISSIF